MQGITTVSTHESTNVYVSRTANPQEASPQLETRTGAAALPAIQWNDVSRLFGENTVLAATAILERERADRYHYMG